MQSQRIQLHQIESFSFMERYPRQAHKGVPAEKAKYGPGIFVFHLKEKQDKVIYMPPFSILHHSSVFWCRKECLLANYVPRERSVGTLPEETYRRPFAVYVWFFILFLMFLILGYYSVGIDAWWGFIPAILSFGLSLFFICMLMTRFCYLTLDNENLTVHSAGRTIRYLYTNLRKVNFDFAREQTFTHVMELLDKDYRYRLFYIGRVSRKKLNEIAERLQQPEWMQRAASTTTSVFIMTTGIER